MAIVLDAKSQGAFSISNSSLTVSHTCTGTNLILVAFVASNKSSGGADPSGVTYNNVAMTKATASSAGGILNAQWWYLINPATSANNIVATWGANQDGGAILAHSYTGAKQSAQPDAISSRQSASEAAVASIDLAITTIANNSMVVAGVALTNGFVVPTPSPHTSEVTQNVLSFSGETADNLQVSHGTNTVTWTQTWSGLSDVMCNISIAPVSTAVSVNSGGVGFSVTGII